MSKPTLLADGTSVLPQFRRSETNVRNGPKRDLAAEAKQARDDAALVEQNDSSVDCWEHTGGGYYVLDAQRVRGKNNLPDGAVVCDSED